MSKKETKKYKTVKIGDIKYDVIYREHNAWSNAIRDLTNLFTIQTMDSYVLVLHGEFPIKYPITVQVRDTINCSILGDVKSNKHRIQSILNRIDFGEIDITSLEAININLAESQSGDNKTNVDIWVRGEDRAADFSSTLKPDEKKTDKKKKKK